ncbi:hypothetical protein AAMO2058_001704200 [Amorphochlora amoebiformis]
MYLGLYYFISFVYRFGMSPDARDQFERLSITFTYYLNQGTIPLAFILGFYVQSVHTRWWNMWMTVAWIDPLAMTCSATINLPKPSESKNNSGSGPKTKEDLELIKKTLLRYCNLGLVLACRSASKKMSAIYPDLEGLVRDGLLTDKEHAEIEKMSKTYLPHGSDWWQPFQWAYALLQDCYDKGMIDSPIALDSIRKEVTRFRGQCSHMFDYDMVGVPIIYTQLCVFE